MKTEQQSAKINRAITMLNEMNGADPEEEHARADLLLLVCLSAIGEEELVAAFEAARERSGFWYA